jgi:hypothetical protein
MRALARSVMFGAIIAGAALSYLVAPAFAVASGAAFLLSESADMAVFTPLARRGWNRALAGEHGRGAVVDSVVFLHLAFGSLAFLDGQVVGKLTMTAAAVALSAVVRPMLPAKVCGMTLRPFLIALLVGTGRHVRRVRRDHAVARQLAHRRGSTPARRRAGDRLLGGVAAMTTTVRVSRRSGRCPVEPTVDR